MDVGEIAKDMGGGGHKKASGFNFYGDIEDTKRQILEVLKKKMKNARNI